MKERLEVTESLNYLIYGALVEIMLDSYSNTTHLKKFDSNLLIKHRNLMVSWQKESKFIFKYVQEGDNGEEAIRQYYQLINILEKIVESTKDEEKFEKLLDLIDEKL